MLGLIMLRRVRAKPVNKSESEISFSETEVD